MVVVGVDGEDDRGVGDLVAREARLQPGPFTTAVFHLTAARRICQLPGDQLALTRT